MRHLYQLANRFKSVTYPIAAESLKLATVYCTFAAVCSEKPETTFDTCAQLWMINRLYQLADSTLTNITTYLGGQNPEPVIATALQTTSTMVLGNKPTQKLQSLAKAITTHPELIILSLATYHTPLPNILDFRLLRSFFVVRSLQLLDSTQAKIQQSKSLLRPHPNTSAATDNHLLYKDFYVSLPSQLQQYLITRFPINVGFIVTNYTYYNFVLSPQQYINVLLPEGNFRWLINFCARPLVYGFLLKKIQQQSQKDILQRIGNDSKIIAQAIIDLGQQNIQQLQTDTPQIVKDFCHSFNCNLKTAWQLSLYLGALQTARLYYHLGYHNQAIKILAMLGPATAKLPADSKKFITAENAWIAPFTETRSWRIYELYSKTQLARINWNLPEFDKWQILQSLPDEEPYRQAKANFSKLMRDHKTHTAEDIAEFFNISRAIIRTTESKASSLNELEGLIDELDKLCGSDEFKLLKQIYRSTLEIKVFAAELILPKTLDLEKHTSKLQRYAKAIISSIDRIDLSLPQQLQCCYLGLDTSTTLYRHDETNTTNQQLLVDALRLPLALAIKPAEFNLSYWQQYCDVLIDYTQKHDMSTIISSYDTGNQLIDYIRHISCKNSMAILKLSSLCVAIRLAQVKYLFLYKNKHDLSELTTEFTRHQHLLLSVNAFNFASYCGKDFDNKLLAEFINEFPLAMTDLSLQKDEQQLNDVNWAANNVIKAYTDIIVTDEKADTNKLDLMTFIGSTSVNNEAKKAANKITAIAFHSEESKSEDEKASNKQIHNLAMRLLCEPLIPAIAEQKKPELIPFNQQRNDFQRALQRSQNFIVNEVANLMEAPHTIKSPNELLIIFKQLKNNPEYKQSQEAISLIIKDTKKAINAARSLYQMATNQDDNPVEKAVLLDVAARICQLILLEPTTELTTRHHLADKIIANSLCYCANAISHNSPGDALIKLATAHLSATKIKEESKEYTKLLTTIEERWHRYTNSIKNNNAALDSVSRKLRQLGITAQINSQSRGALYFLKKSIEIFNMMSKPTTPHRLWPSNNAAVYYKSLYYCADSYWQLSRLEPYNHEHISQAKTLFEDISKAAPPSLKISTATETITLQAAAANFLTCLDEKQNQNSNLAP